MAGGGTAEHAAALVVMPLPADGEWLTGQSFAVNGGGGRTRGPASMH